MALPEIFPVLEGQMVPIEDIPKMVHEGKLESLMAEELERKYEQFRQEFTVVYRKTLTLSRELASELSYLEQEAASVLVDGFIEELKEKYAVPQAAEYLEEVRHNILDNLDPFKEREGEEEAGRRPAEREPAEASDRRTAIPSASMASTFCWRTTKQDSSPVIFETTPTLRQSLRHHPAQLRFARRVDLRFHGPARRLGAARRRRLPDHVRARRARRSRRLAHPEAHAQSRQARDPAAGNVFPVRHFGAQARAHRPQRENHSHRRPRISTNCSTATRRSSRKIFKVRVEFDEEMEMSDDVIRQYSGRLRKLCEDEGLCPFDRTAVAAHDRIRRAAGRTPQQSDRAILRLGRPGARSLLRGAAVAARRRSPPRICAPPAKPSVERHNLIETKIREMIAEGTLLIDTEGARIGQVNGLSVLEIGGYLFGKPVRITASTALGKSGLINIERESNLSGRLHDKGMQIIAGYLRSQFAQDKPLSLAASICFEQSYMRRRRR